MSWFWDSCGPTGWGMGVILVGTLGLLVLSVALLGGDSCPSGEDRYITHYRDYWTTTCHMAGKVSVCSPLRHHDAVYACFPKGTVLVPAAPRDGTQ